MSNMILALVLLVGLGMTGSMQATDTSPILRGTINVIIANRNGIVALTDSMQTETSPAGQRQLPDPGQKLFKLDDTTVCTIAGFGSAATPTAPEFLNSASAIIHTFSLQANSGQPKTVAAKLRSLQSLFEFYLSAIANFRNGATSAGNYQFQLLIAGYDPDGTPKIGGMVIDAIPDPSGKFVVGVSKQIFLRGVGREVQVVFGGQHDVFADKVLRDPTAWPIDPAIATYAASLKRDSGASLSIEEMKNFAIAIAKQTAVRSASVGGPNQIAILSSGRISSIQQPNFPSPQIPTLAFVMIRNKSLPAGSFYFNDNKSVEMYLGDEILGGTLKLDNNFFLGNRVQDCRVIYNGGPTGFDSSNQVINSILVIGKDANRDTAEVRELLKNHHWRSVEYEK